MVSNSERCWRTGHHYKQPVLDVNWDAEESYAMCLMSIELRDKMGRIYPLFPIPLWSKVFLPSLTFSPFQWAHALGWQSSCHWLTPQHQDRMWKGRRTRVRWDIIQCTCTKAAKVFMLQTDRAVNEERGGAKQRIWKWYITSAQPISCHCSGCVLFFIAFFHVYMNTLVNIWT